MILLYCIITSFIVCYRITVRFILLYYGTCIGLGIELHLATQLFSCSAASMLYNKVELRWVRDEIENRFFSERIDRV